MKASRLAVALLLVTPVSAFQTPEKKTAPAKTVKTSSAASEETKKLQAQARSLLIALSTDARSFRDQKLRARSLARIADALWQADVTEARAMFRKAWEAAEVADQESYQKVQEERKQQLATGGGGFTMTFPSGIRREVLRLAARRDRTLGEEFLEKLKTQKKEEVANAERNGAGRLSEALSQRIGLARELLMAGEIERAVEFADPALSVVSMETVSFLSDLREKNASLADTRYVAMAANAGSNPQSDANTASMLSSYIFTPGFFLIFNGNGTSSSMRSQTIVPIEASPELRAAFFQSASSILLRPLPAPGEPDQSTSGLDGKYLVIKRLLPLFEQSSSAEMVAALRGQLNALTTLVSEQSQRRDDEILNKGIKPDTPAGDIEQSLLDKIARAKTSAERDALYVQLTNLTSRKGDLTARDYASKIEDTETRKQVQAYTDGILAGHMVQKKLVDLALELAAKGDLSHLQRTWLFVECAKLAVETDRDKALGLINQATDEARRIDGSDPGLPRALMAVANGTRIVDLARVWDTTFDAVKAANSAEGYTGEDGMLVHRMVIKDGQSSISTASVPDFDVTGLFRELAGQDYERAVELARGFQGEGPRAVATIAIARAVLEPKKKVAAK